MNFLEAVDQRMCKLEDKYNSKFVYQDGEFLQRKVRR